MAYGIETYLAGGSTLITGQAVSGGRVYVGEINKSVDATSGVVTTYTYTDIPGGTYLKVFQAAGGAHTWTTGTNGSGQATVTLTSRSINNNISTTPATRLSVFTTLVTEPSYGISTINNNGEALFSTIYPTPKYIGKVTFSSTPTYSWDAAEASYWIYQHNSTIALAASTKHIVLWKLPTNTGDVWFSGTNYINTISAASYTVSAQYIRPTGAAFTMPEAFVFALDNLPASADTYGIRTYNASGALLYDGGINHMNIESFSTSLSYPTSTGSSNSFSWGNLDDNAAFFVPKFTRETWTWTSPSLSSTGKAYEGGVRRDGTTLYSRLIKTANYYEDIAGITGTYSNGLSSSLLQSLVDATNLT